MAPFMPLFSNPLKQVTRYQQRQRVNKLEDDWERVMAQWDHQMPSHTQTRDSHGLQVLRDFISQQILDPDDGTQDELFKTLVDHVENQIGSQYRFLNKEIRQKAASKAFLETNPKTKLLRAKSVHKTPPKRKVKESKILKKLRKDTENSISNSLLSVAEGYRKMMPPLSLAVSRCPKIGLHPLNKSSTVLGFSKGMMLRNKKKVFYDKDLAHYDMPALHDERADEGVNSQFMACFKHPNSDRRFCQCAIDNTRYLDFQGPKWMIHHSP